MFTNQNTNITSYDSGYTEISPVLNADHSPINQNILGGQCSTGPSLSQIKHQITNPNKPHTSRNSSVSFNEDQHQISRLCKSEPQSQGITQSPLREYQYQSSSQNLLCEYQYQSSIQNPLREYQCQSFTQNPLSGNEFQSSRQNPLNEYQYQSSTQNPLSGNEFQSSRQNPQNEYQYQSSTQNPLSGNEFQSSRQNPQNEYQYQSSTQNPMSGNEFQSSTQNPQSEYQYQSSTQNPQNVYQYQSSTQNPLSGDQCYCSEQKPLKEEFMIKNQALNNFARTEVSHQNYHGVSNGLDTVNLQQNVKSSNRNKEVHYPQLQLCNRIPHFGRNHDLAWKTTVSDSYSDKTHRNSTVNESECDDNSTHTNFPPFIFPMHQSVLYQNEPTIVDFPLWKNKSQSPSKIRKTKSLKAKPYVPTPNSTQQEMCDISCNDWTRVVSPYDDHHGRDFKLTSCPNSITTIFSYSKYNHHCNNLIGEQFLMTEQRQCSRLKSIVFGEPVSHIYNPLVYAFETHLDFINKYCTTEKKFLFLGMNPGPWGMAQNGVPFGEVDVVQNWLSIRGNVRKPKREHPYRPIHGLQCKRSEISGSRFWGLMRDISHHPNNFFRHCFVHNMCPLSFMTSSGKNITPPELQLDQRNQLNTVCDAMLSDVIHLLNVQVVIAVGRFVEARVEKVLKSQNFQNVTVKCLAHPSPLNRTANKGWRELACRQLEEFGVLPYLMGTTQTKDSHD